MFKLQVITGTTRPNCVSPAVASWITEIAAKRTDLEVELVDIADYNLPLFDEPMSPAYGGHTKEHSIRWGAKVAQADAYVFVVAEYNHGPAAALKNAIDFPFSEWANKSVGFVSYGSVGGARAVEQLRQVAAEVQLADVRPQVLLGLSTDFENYSEFKPLPNREAELGAVLDRVVAWGEALKLLHS